MIQISADLGIPDESHLTLVGISCKRGTKRCRSFSEAAEGAWHASTPVYGDLVVSDKRLDRGRWVIQNASVPLDTVLDLIDEGRATEEILMRHILILRADLIAITMRHGLTGQ